MKPINIKKIRFAVCLISILSFMGCVNDDLSVCGITIVFKYTDNTAGIDKFDSDVKNVNLYVFDSEGVFIEELKLIGSNSVKLNLMPGKYDLVAWGNMNDHYLLSELLPGVTKMDELTLKIAAHQNNEVKEALNPLFYGSIMHKEILEDRMAFQADTIPLIKNTKHIRVTYELPATKAVDNSFSCEIESYSSHIKFDNTVSGSEVMHYKRHHVEMDTAQQMVSHITLARELGTIKLGEEGVSDQGHHTRSKLFVLDGEAKLDSFSLFKLLLLNFDRNDKNREKLYNARDTFDIKLFFRYTNGTVNVSLEEWQGGEGNGPI